MRKEHRLALAALCGDFALYLVMLSLPYRVMEAGASSLVLGLVPMLYAGPYSLVALGAGRFSDRWPRRGPIRFGLGLAVLAGLVLWRTNRLEVVLAAVPLIGVGLGFFWASLQAGMSEVRGGRDLPHLTRLFNVSWSTGKGLGLVLGGLLLAKLGAGGLALLAAASWTCAAVVVPWMQRPGDHREVVESDEARPSAQRQRAFLYSAWIANGLAFGVAATLNHHLPKVLAAGGTGADRFGLFLGSVFLSQTVLFLWAGPRKSWHYRAAPLVAVQFLVALAVSIAPSATSTVQLLALAPLFGIGLGFAYQSSLYYSLHSPLDRGKQAGIHEGALGLTSAALPLLGGYLVRFSDPRAPFGVAALAVAAAALVSLWLFWRSRPARVVG